MANSSVLELIRVVGCMKIFEDYLVFSVIVL